MDGKSESAICALGLFGLQGWCAGPAVQQRGLLAPAAADAARELQLCALDLLRHPAVQLCECMLCSAHAAFMIWLVDAVLVL